MKETIKTSELYKNAIKIVAGKYIDGCYGETDFETLHMLFKEYDLAVISESVKEENNG